MWAYNLTQTYEVYLWSLEKKAQNTVKSLFTIFLQTVMDFLYLCVRGC